MFVKLPTLWYRNLMWWFFFSISDAAYRFFGNHTHTDYFKLLNKDGQSLLIGARNVIYNISLPYLTENVQQVGKNIIDLDINFTFILSTDTCFVLTGLISVAQKNFYIYNIASVCGSFSRILNLWHDLPGLGGALCWCGQLKFNFNFSSNLHLKAILVLFVIKAFK